MPQRDGYENSVSYTVSLALVFTICIGLLRIWIRRGAYGRDDLVIALATLVSFTQTAASYAAISFGLGKTWSGITTEGDLEALNQATIAAIVLFFIALYLSKCSMLAFLSRITKTPSQIILYHVLTCVVGVLGLISVIVAFAGCPTSFGYYWAFNTNMTTCPSQSARWQAITALDFISEVLILVLPIHLVWNLQMALAKKAMIIVAFWIRLPILGFSLGRNYYTLQLRHKRPDAGLDSALVTVWLQVELAYAIGASTLSALKSFTESINTRFGLGFTRGKGGDAYGLSDVSGTSSQAQNEKGFISATSRHAHRRTDRNPEREIGSLEARIRPARHMRNVDEPPLRLRPDIPIVATVTSVSAGVSADANGEHSLWRANSSVGSDGLDELVILRETAYEIHHDEAPILAHEVRA